MKKSFLAISISVLLVLLLSAFAWFLVHKYIWQPQQEFLDNQFQAAQTKVADISNSLTVETAALLEAQTTLADLQILLNELSDKTEPHVVKLLNGAMRYTVPEMHLSAQYPSNWEAILDLQENSRELILRTADTAELVAKKALMPYYENNLVISYYENWDQFYALDLENGDLLNNVDDLFSGKYKLPFLWTKIGETEIANNKAHEFIAGGMGQHYGLFVENDLGIYVFELRRSNSKEDISAEDAALLQKIKFLE